MLIPTMIMGLFAAVLLYIGYSRGEGEHITGLNSTLKMTLEILPLLIFAFLVAGMVQVLIPRDLISKWVGDESGFRGILIGTIAGGNIVMRIISPVLMMKSAGIPRSLFGL